MKKIILTGCVALSALFAGSLNAQTFAEVEKATDATPFSIEVFVKGGNTGIDWHAPSLRARYFLNDNIAARIQLGIGDGLGSPMVEKNRFYETIDNTGGEGTQQINRAAANFQIGAEYHFLGTKKLDPYAAFGVNFGFGTEKTVGEMYNDGAYAGSGIPVFGAQPTGYNEDYSYESKGGYSVIGATLGLGMDFYFVENVYVGLELGIGVNSQKYKDGERVDNAIAGGTEYTFEAVSEGYTRTHMGTHALVRLGWRF